MKRRVLSSFLVVAITLSMAAATGLPVASAAEPPIFYTHDSLGFTINIPRSWLGLYFVQQYADGARFYNTKNYNAGWGGYLFEITVKNRLFSVDDLRPGEFLWKMVDGKYIYVDEPTDVQFNYENKSLTDEYNKMSDDLRASILGSFRFEVPAYVVLNGKLMEFEVQPQILNGRTIVPLRAIFEAFGAKVVWNEATQTVTATKADTTVVLKIGSLSPTVNGKVVTLDQSAIIKNSRMLAPLRFVAEAFGGVVTWDGETRTATIKS